MADVLFSLGLSPDMTQVDQAIQRIGDRLAKGSLAAGGASLGLALGGPLGALAGGALGAVGGTFAANHGGGLGGLAGRAGLAPLEGMRNALHSLQEPLGPIALGLNVMTTGLNEMSKAVKSIPLLGGLLGPLTDALATVPGVFKDITETLVSFAAKVSPATFRQMQIAVDSVQATIGQAFLPVMELMRDGINGFADVLANLLPNASEVRDALAEFRSVFGDAMKELKGAAVEAGPTIRGALIEGLKQLAHWGAVAVKVIGMLAERLKNWLHLGNLATGTTADERLKTLPAAPANVQSFQSYQQSFQTAAFSQGGGGGKTPAEQSAESLKNIEGINTQAKEWLEKIDTFSRQVGQWWNANWPKFEAAFSQSLVAIQQIATIVGDIYKFFYNDSAKQSERGAVQSTKDLVDGVKKRGSIDQQIRELQERKGYQHHRRRTWYGGNSGYE